MMAYNTKLADKVREALASQADVEEKEMFRGVCFMVNGKMCVCVSDNELMCRIGEEATAAVVEENGIRQMVMRGKVLNDYIYVSEEAWHRKQDFDRWIKLSLDFNPKAKASKKKKKA